MTRLLLFATQAAPATSAARAAPAGAPTALLRIGDATAVDRLVAQFRELDDVEVTVVTRPGWADELRAAGHSAVESEDVAGDLAVIGAAATATEGAVVLAAADLVAHRGALASFAGPGVRRTVAAVQAAQNLKIGAYGEPVQRERDMVISVGTSQRTVTRPNAVFRPLVTVSADDRPRLRAACAALRTEAIESGRDLDADAGVYGAVGLALLGLVRTGVVVAAYNPRLFVCHRVDSAAAADAAATALAALDEPAAAVAMGVKEDDEFLVTYLVHSYTPALVSWFAKRGITPTQVTWMSIGVGVAAATLFAFGIRWLDIVGAVLLYASFILDCNDGSLARYTGRFSRYGGWLDMIADRAKEYAVFAGVAIGGARMHQPDIWGLALAAIVAQTVRHMIDTWYGALQDTATRALPVVPIGSRLDRLGLRASATGLGLGAGQGSHSRSGSASGGADGGSGGGSPDSNGAGGRGADGGGARGAGAKLGQLSAAAHGRYRSPGYWLKRSVVFPIGDRWLLMALAVAIGGPRVMFISLLIAISLAFAYVLAGRALRALSMRVAVMPRFDIGFQRDDGPIAGYLGRLGGGRVPPLGAILPGLAVALAAAGLAIAGDRGPRWLVLVYAAIALLAATAASSRHDGPLDWLTVAGLRATEYTFIVVAGVLGGVPLWLVYTLLFGLAIYHYDVTGRIEKQATPVRGDAVLRGWDIRMVILAITTAIGWATAAYAVMAAVICVVFVGCALLGWWRSTHADAAPATAPVPAAASK